MRMMRSPLLTMATTVSVWLMAWYAGPVTVLASCPPEMTAQPCALAEPGLVMAQNAGASHGLGSFGKAGQYFLYENDRQRDELRRQQEESARQERQRREEYEHQLRRQQDELNQQRQQRDQDFQLRPHSYDADDDPE